MAHGAEARSAACALFLLMASTAGATGPSRATVEMRPVAVSAGGVVLFKTWRELSPSGSPAPQRSEAAWLVVSGDGLWREVHHATYDPAIEKTDGRWVRLLEEFRREFDWKAPPASVRPLLKEFGLTQANRVVADAGKGAVTWSPPRLCLGPHCTEVAISQWAPSGMVNRTGEGRPIASDFYAAGVALFRWEGREKWATPDQEGAVFVLPPNQFWDEREGLVDIGYSLQCVDGIAIVPRWLRALDKPGLQTTEGASSP